MAKPRIIIFASGDKEGGGSGFEELVDNITTGILDAKIVAVVSNHENGGVRKRADKLGIPFHYMPGPYNADSYQAIVKKFEAEWICLSGWLKLVKGLPANRTINIHSGPLPEYGGYKMYGHHVHEKVIADFKLGKIKCSAVTMHFVTPEYDEGPIFFYFPILIRDDDTPETLAARVNKVEHCYQSRITNLVVHKKIRLGSHGAIVPDWYPFLKKSS